MPCVHKNKIVTSWCKIPVIKMEVPTSGKATEALFFLHQTLHLRAADQTQINAVMSFCIRMLAFVNAIVWDAFGRKKQIILMADFRLRYCVMRLVCWLVQLSNHIFCLGKVAHWGIYLFIIYIYLFGKFVFIIDYVHVVLSDNFFFYLTHLSADFFFLFCFF